MRVVKIGVSLAFLRYCLFTVIDKKSSFTPQSLVLKEIK